MDRLNSAIVSFVMLDDINAPVVARVLIRLGSIYVYLFITTSFGNHNIQECLGLLLKKEQKVTFHLTHIKILLSFFLPTKISKERPRILLLPQLSSLKGDSIRFPICSLFVPG